MRILFLENRYSTYVWDAIAEKLVDAGHEIFWIIQNRAYTPATGENFFLDLTQKMSIEEKVYDNDIIKVINSHRGLRHYNVDSDDHVFVARKQIKNIINKVQPDVAFGECTLFHEVISMQVMRNMGKPYLFPTSCRYPLLRFSFYSYDSLFPFGGSQEKLSYNDALKMVTEISQKKLKPLSLVNTYEPSPKKIDLDKLTILRGYYSGERFNTPGIFRKIRITLNSKKNISHWNSTSQSAVPQTSCFKILYPLQMQPESTIDVWATEFNDQQRIIKNLLDNSPENVLVIVKPNPSSSQEITIELINFVKNNPRVIPLHHSMKIDEVLDYVDLVVTTTGTVALESIFANKPVVNLIPGFFNKASSCIYMSDYAELPEIIQSVEAGEFPVLTDEEKVNYLNYLNATSYQGLIGCTYMHQAALNPLNINNLTRAFLKTLQDIKSFNSALSGNILNQLVPRNKTQFRI